MSLSQNNLPHTKRLGRELAMQYLFSCDVSGELPDAERFAAFYESVKDEHDLKDNRYGRKVREYAERLYLEVALHRDDIDAEIKKRSQNWSWDRMSLVDRNIMRVAIAEMFYFEDVPPIVSIDEAVEIAMDYSDPQSGGYINGVLNTVKGTLSRDERTGVK